jgi:arsenite methyltransferase
MSAEKSQDEIRAWVSDYYGKVLKASKDLKTNACCASGKPPKWMQLALSKIHPDVLDKFYGCGFPFPHAVEGCTAVDLVSCDFAVFQRVRSLGSDSAAP